MSGNRAEVATTRTVELVPGRDGTWAPAARQHPAARAVRAWLQVWLNPAPPESYLGPDEQCLIRTRGHWLVPLRAIARAAVSMPLALVLTLVLAFLAPGWWWLQVGMWLGTLAHQLYIVYLVVSWRVDELIVTDRRLIRVHGVFTTTVDAVTLTKITDTSLHRSFVGHVLGYGSLRIETSGQTQSLERLEFVPNPGDVYRSLA